MNTDNETWMFTGSQPSVGRFEVRRDAQDYAIFIFPIGGDMVERWRSRWCAAPFDLSGVYETLREFGFTTGGE